MLREAVEITHAVEPIRTIKLRWLHGALGDLTYHLSRVEYCRFAKSAWQPAINAYRCQSCLRICVDLAGVEKSEIELTVEPRRVVVQGTRDVPEPRNHEGRALQMIAMEIDYGPFAREIELPTEVDVSQVTAE